MDEHRGFRPPNDSDDESLPPDEDGPRSVFADVPDAEPTDGPLISFPESEEVAQGFELEMNEDDEAGPALKFSETSGEPTGALPHWSAPADAPPESTGVMPVVNSGGPPDAPEPGVAFNSDDLFGSERDDQLNAWSEQAPEPIWQDASAGWEDSAPMGSVPAQDPGSYEPAGQPEGAAPGSPIRESGGDRNLPAAVVTGLALAAVFLGLMSLDRPGFAAAFVVPIIVLIHAEFLTASRRAGYRPAHLLGIVGTAGLTLGAFWVGEAVYPIVLGIAVMLTMGWYLMEPLQRPLANAALTLMSIMWIGFLGSFALLMLKHPDGKGLLLAAVLVAVAYDIAGYFVGRSAGRAKLAPHVSPNKTYEGLVGGMLAAGITAIAITIPGGGLTPWNSLSDGIFLALGVAIAAPIGDLTQSLMKRDLGIKDMGTILPGHGGLLDRFDSLLFVLPTVYFVARFVGIL
ncbi:MAG: phosphatidate cytidylyltransferase [Acidimicrobiales bacterium]